MRRIALSPRWLGWHVLMVAAVVTCVVLGRWQLGRAGESGSLQNMGYAVQWPLFAVFFVLLWWRMLLLEIRDARQAVAAEPVRPAAELAAPTQLPQQRRAEIVRAEQEDPQLAAYNRYLARLAATDRGD